MRSSIRTAGRGWSVALLLGAAVAAAGVSGCAPLLVGGVVVGGALIATDRRTSGAQVEDSVIEVKSNGRMDETFGDRARISTTSYNRMVLLTGEVPTEADKTTAEQVVARIDNVQSVVNEVKVGPLNTFGEKSRDAYITAKVKAALVDSKDPFANTIKVVTHRATVYLMGRVTESEANRATELTRRVGGVAKVVKVFEMINAAQLNDAGRKTLVTPEPASSPPPINAAPVAESRPVRP